VVLIFERCWIALGGRPVARVSPRVSRFRCWSGHIRRGSVRCGERANAREDLGEKFMLGWRAQDQPVGVADQSGGHPQESVL